MLNTMKSTSKSKYFLQIKIRTEIALFSLPSKVVVFLSNFEKKIPSKIIYKIKIANKNFEILIKKKIRPSLLKINFSSFSATLRETIFFTAKGRQKVEEIKKKD